MGTVKYTGPVASFHCPTNAEIRSLKVHFSPKQEGSGDPSPENVREIVGWDGVEAYQTGKNIWDEEWESGYLNTTTGLNATSLNQIRAKNYIPLLPNTIYTVKALSKGTIWACFFDSDKVIIKDYTPINLSRSANVYAISGKTFTTPNNCAYMRFYFTDAYGTIYNNDVMITVDLTATLYEPYRGSTTNYEFGVLGKNKLPIGTTTFTRYKQYILENPLQPGIYTVSALITSTDTDKTTSSIMFEKGRLEDKNLYVQLDRDIENSKTFTLQQECSKVYLYAATEYDSSANDVCTWSNVQLELGSTATTYEPYDPNHTVYGGWVDLITGEVCEEYGMVETTWGAMGGADVRGNYERRQLNVSSIGFIGASAGNLNNRPNRRFCNIAPWRWSYYDDQLHYYADMGIAYVFLPINSDDNITIRIVCYLATPNTYNLAPIELQTFLGQNNVWSNADYVEVEYDLHETQDILVRKQFIVANQPHIVKSAAAPLQNFVTDVSAPLKECKVYFGPVQDLHGYSNPWPAGGGKNIAKPYDNNYVSSTYVSFDYSAANGTFRCYGTASASSTHSSPSATNAINNGAAFTLPAGTYTLSIIDGDGANIYAQCVSSTETVLAETTSYITFTTNEALTVFVRLKVAAGATVDNTVKIQLEAGSTATSYVPYENICPISGWNGINVNHAKKSIFPFLVTSMTNSRGTMYNGYNEWCQQSSNFNHLSGVKLTYSVYVDATNAESTDNNNVRIWGKYKDGSWAFLATGGNNIAPGASGVSVKTITIPNNLDWIAFGLGLAKNVVVSNPIVEVGDTRTEYESYNGTTIPITFPATKNLFDEKYEGIISSLTYHNLYVGNETVTASTTTPQYVSPSDASIKYSNIFVLPGQVTTGAGTGTNDICVGRTRTITPIDGYITIAYRSSNGVDPRNYQTQIERGSTATSYEPYGTIYGGYVDLVTGEVWKTWDYVALDTLRWETFGGAGVFYNSSIRRKAGKQIYSNILTPTTTSGTSYASVQPTQIYYYKTNTTYKNYLITRNPDFAGNLNGYRQWMKDTYPGAVAFYELETPVLLITLTPTQLKTLRGTNNIWSNTNGNINLAYWSH